MNDKCLSRNPLVRDGTSQPGRLLKTLLPGYVSVDERNMKDLIEFAQLFADEVHFFNNTNTQDETWYNFFQLTTQDWDAFSIEEYLAQLKVLQETKPHWALFFAFLHLFKIAQDDLNTITKRHLDFYYRRVLQLEEKPAVTDQVNVIFKLAKHVSSHLIKKGTILKAGKDQSGVELFYKVEKDVVVNKATIASIKSLFVNIPDDSKTPLPDLDDGIYASPISNSADGLGAELESTQKDWRTFGSPHLFGGVSDRTLGEIGFAVASPQLYLAEGTRTVTLSFNGANELSNSDISVFFSGEEEWIEASLAGINDEGNLEIELSTDQPPIVAYNKEELLEPFRTNYPVLKVVLNNHDSYETLKGISLAELTITVVVEGVRQLVLQNDQAVLDASKPFQPFTNRPFIGSNFYIGSWEVFQKSLGSLSLNIDWSELPANFNGYYSLETGSAIVGQVYNNSSISQNSFKVDPSVLNQKSWIDLAQKNIFDNSINISGASSTRDENLKALKKYGVGTNRGFLKLTLNGKDFGHNEYPNIYAKQAIALAKYPSPPPTTAGPVPVLPNAPYTPTIEQISLNYSSSETLNLDSNNGIDQFFHIEPFGVKEIKTKDSLFPKLVEEGHLYIGLENLAPPQALSILFQVAEGSANPDKAKQKVNWSYLINNEWKTFDENQILAEATNGLLNSGIIQFDIPRDATNGNTLLPKTYHWIRATVSSDSDAICRLVDVQAQAVVARFFDQNNDPNHLGTALPSETIAKLYRSDASIDKVLQPYASYGGKLKEKDAAFYTRVSERLRHKRRAITMWDYERLILEKFPEVYKVKCINHTRFQGTLENYSEIAPGHVTMIIVSNVQNKNAVDPLRPKTSLTMLSKIEQYIKTISPPCIKLHFKNPLYEEIKVKFKVKFLSGVDVGFFLQKLEEEIRFYLSPWAAECPKDIVFGGKIHKSMILNFVEERSYVDYVTCFKMYHFVPSDSKNNSEKDLDEISATTAVSILGSADHHTISEISKEEGDCGCDDNVVIPLKEIASADDCSC